jgi:hypothetical protein
LVIARKSDTSDAGFTTYLWWVPAEAKGGVGKTVRWEAPSSQDPYDLLRCKAVDLGALTDLAAQQEQDQWH